jgi:hypothetical protein
MLALAVTAASGFFPATMNLVDGGPGPTLGLVLGNAPILVAFLYVLSLPLLLVGVFGFVSAWHRFLLLIQKPVQTPYRETPPPAW